MIKLYTEADEQWLYRFSLSVEDGLAECLWHEEQTFPPLAPRSAIAVARRALAAMLQDPSRADSAKFSEFALCQAGGYWYYAITWMLSPLGSGDSQSLRIPVYFNAQIPSYETFPYDQRYEVWLS